MNLLLTKLRKLKVCQQKIPLRSDPTVDNLTNLIMRHGKKAKAQKL